MQISTSKNNNRILLCAFLLSLFSVLFLWRFWQHGIYILGINSVIYGLGVLGFFWYANRDKLSKKSWTWMIPLILIVLSLGIYTSTFTKGISVFLLPILFFVFSSQEIHKLMARGHSFVSEILLAFMDYIGAVFLSFGDVVFKKNVKLIPNLNLTAEKRSILKQVSLGILLLVLLSFFIIIPLLSSADSTFGNVFNSIMNTFGDLLESFFKANIVSRAFVLILGMMFLLGFATYWASPRESRESLVKGAFVKENPITINIILGGVLALYLIFIGIQIKSLFLGELPLNFDQTVYFVKTGFWQLFLLTIINIFFYMGIYGKSNKTVQRILGIFTFASLLLILSGAHRTYLYVANYGLSYEKFYALYTVIFCVGIFIWFISLFIDKKEHPQIFKKLAFAALWMYALTTIIPLEWTIVSVNFKLTQQADSRVDINELRMLGYDALPFIEKNFEEFMTLAKMDSKKYLEMSANSYEREPLLNTLKAGKVNFAANITNQTLSELYVETIWLYWAKEQIGGSKNLNYQDPLDYLSTYNHYNKYNKPEKNKRWYEKTMIELIYQPKIATAQ